MHLSTAIAALLPLFATASPYPRLSSRSHNSTCPSKFTLSVYSPSSHPWNNLTVIESGRSTYVNLNGVAAGSTDNIATFFRNDTTHLYATGFKTSYMNVVQTPPYQLITLQDSGFPTFSSNPTSDMKYLAYDTGSYSEGYVEGVGKSLEFNGTDGSSFPGWWVCGGDSGTSWEVLTGTSEFNATENECTSVKMIMHPTNCTTALDIC